MSWTPIIQYSFENHAAIDESGNGNYGLVELPNPNRWIDAPEPGIASAILYDHPQSKITIPTKPTFANWAGFRVNILFKASPYNRRLNLVEGDGSFAFFIEKDGALTGTIFDGNKWYGVASRPGTVLPDRWYFAEFRYDPASIMVLRLNNVRVGLFVSHADPVRPVGSSGIKIGYWPGGDERYTFSGLIGRVSISTLDLERELLNYFGKLICADSMGAVGRLEELLPVFEKELSDQEKQRSEQSTATLLNAVKLTLAATISTSTDVNNTISQLQSLSDRANKLLIQNQQVGTDLFVDPKLKPLLEEGYKLITTTSQNARDTLIAQVIKLLAVRPFSEARLAELLERYPQLKRCATGFGTVISQPDATKGGISDAGKGIADDLEKICRDLWDSCQGNHTDCCDKSTQPSNGGTTANPKVGHHSCSDVHININCGEQAK